MITLGFDFIVVIEVDKQKKRKTILIHVFCNVFKATNPKIALLADHCITRIDFVVFVWMINTFTLLDMTLDVQTVYYKYSVVQK